MSSTSECPLCGVAWENNEYPNALDSKTYFACERCGSFGAETELFEELSKLSLDIRRSLTRLILEVSDPECRDTPLISDALVELASSRKIRITEMAEKLLVHCVRNADSLGCYYSLEDVEILRVCHAFNREEVRILAEFLFNLGFCDDPSDLYNFRISPAGYQRVEDGALDAGDVSQAFIAMWFNPDMNEVFELGFAKAISDSGYAPFRIDKKEHIQKIDDEIIAEIRKSKFLVADFTDHRGGVYFESGFAMGLGLPVIWTCRQDHMEKLHFDIRQYNCIDWSSVDDLRVRLSNRIVALLGSGPLKSQ